MEVIMTAIDLSGSQEQIEAIIALAKQVPELTVSEPMDLDASKALNVGLPPVSPNEVLQFLTLVFTTGTAGLAFLSALRNELREHGGTVTITDSATGKSLGRIDGGTTNEELARTVPS
jgi:hypothetical protein